MRTFAVGLLLSAFAIGGCAPLVGAGAAAGAYEYQNKQQLEKLETQYEQGQINRDEYLQRKQAIQGGSAIY